MFDKAKSKRPNTPLWQAQCSFSAARNANGFAICCHPCCTRDNKAEARAAKQNQARSTDSCMQTLSAAQIAALLTQVTNCSEYEMRSAAEALACSCLSILRRPVLPQSMLDRTPRARVPQTRQPLAPTTTLCAAERSPSLQLLLAMQAHAHLETTHMRGKPLAQASVAKKKKWSNEEKLTSAQHTAVPVLRGATVEGNMRERSPGQRDTEEMLEGRPVHKTPHNATIKCSLPAPPQVTYPVSVPPSPCRISKLSNQFGSRPISVWVPYLGGKLLGLRVATTAATLAMHCWVPERGKNASCPSHM